MADELMEAWSTKLPKHMAQELVRLATKEQRPASAMIRILLQEAMEHRSRAISGRTQFLKVPKQK